MSAYQIVGPVKTLTADTTPDLDTIAFADLTGSLAGGVAPLFVKVTNASTTVPVFFNASTGALSVATGGTVVAPSTTEFIQVTTAQAFATINLATSAASSVTVYVTPVLVVA
jgi:hypothetical protein